MLFSERTTNHYDLLISVKLFLACSQHCSEIQFEDSDQNIVTEGQAFLSLFEHFLFVYQVLSLAICKFYSEKVDS